MSQFVWEDAPSSSVERGVQFKEVNCFNLPFDAITVIRFLGNGKPAQTHWIAGEERSRGCMETSPGKCPFRWKGKHAYHRPTWFAPAQIGTERFEKGDKTFSQHANEKGRGKALNTKWEWEDCVLSIPKHFFQQLPDGDLRGWIVKAYRLPKRDKNGKALSKRSIRVQEKYEGGDFPDPSFEVIPVMERIWGLDPNVIQALEQDPPVEEVREVDFRAELETMKEQQRLIFSKLEQLLQFHAPHPHPNGNGQSHGQGRTAAEGGVT